MRSMTVLAVAAAISATLSAAPRAEEPADSHGNAPSSLKRVYQPNETMTRATDIGKLDAGAADRGKQAVGPASPDGGGLTPGAADRGKQAVGPAAPGGGDQPTPPRN
jgi:hypothetical protein